MKSEIFETLSEAFAHAKEVITRAIALIKKIFAFFKGEPVEETVENTEE